MKIDFRREISYDFYYQFSEKWKSWNEFFIHENYTTRFSYFLEIYEDFLYTTQFLVNLIKRLENV